MPELTQEQFNAISEMQKARIEELERQNAHYETLLNQERSKKVEHGITIGRAIQFIETYGKLNDTYISMIPCEVAKLMKILKGEVVYETGNN